MRNVMTALFVAASLSLVACDSAPKGQKDADKLNSSIDAFGQAAGQAESTLKMTVEAYANLLNAEGDYTEPYKTFSKGVQDCMKILDSMRGALEDADKASTNYFQTYEMQLTTIEDEATRADSKARLEARRASYKGLQEKVKSGIANYEPILRKLKAHSDALGLELTKARVEGIKAQSEEVKKLATDWYENNEAIKKDVEEYLKENSASGGQAPEGEAAK